MAVIHYEKDADAALIAGRKVAIIGYGSQGHAHALNLKESGVDVRVGLRDGSSSKAKAEGAGLRVTPIDRAAAEADLVMMLLPDTEQKAVYEESIQPHLNQGDALFFAHGFNVRFDQILPPPGVDVAMVAPKGPGHLVRRTYTEGGGVPSLIAVAQDASGKARELALSYADAIGATRAGVLDTTFEVGLSGPGRLHDLFVTHEAMSPGEWKSGGSGLTMAYGFHPSPFGTALVMTTQRGLAGLAFADPGEEQAALADMKARWPMANIVEDRARTASLARRIFDSRLWRADRPLRVVLIGTDFEVRVWETLLRIPMGRAVTYSGIAAKIGATKAARAVGAAVGKNPVSFVVPCHRVLGKSGDVTGYYWGLTRKRAMLGWEAAKVTS